MELLVIVVLAVIVIGAVTALWWKYREERREAPKLYRYVVITGSNLEYPVAGVDAIENRDGFLWFRSGGEVVAVFRVMDVMRITRA